MLMPAALGFIVLWLGCGDSPAEPNSAPTATITAPSSEARFLAGESVGFEGGGSDSEDGVLAASSLVWTSDKDGHIGTGASFSLTDLSLGVHRVELVATDSEGASDMATVTLVIDPPPEPGYQIDVRFIGSIELTEAERDLFHQAARRWEEVIIGDVPDIVVQRRESFQCDRVEVPELDQLVDDLIVYVEIAPLDGPWNGWGAPCVLRDSYLPVLASVVINVDSRSSLDYDLALHELGHAIGFGEVWDELGLLKDPAHPSRGISLIEASEDATVSSAAPDGNYGIPNGTLLTESLAIGADLGVWPEGPGEGTYLSLVRFDFAGVATEQPILTAYFNLALRVSSGPNPDVKIRSVTSDWDEAGVTWSTRPSVEEEPEYDLDVALCTPWCWFNDVTASVRAWLLQTEPSYGFALATPAATPDFAIGLYARHAADSLRRPHLHIIPDTHFSGTAALAAFDAAGGDAYTLARVPVENNWGARGESVDGHWRADVIYSEVMSSSRSTSVISAITVGALEDMGYTVDYAAADPYSL
jgi:hypothetical protein